ncbi:adenylyltransferase/cytidyltransferase family protein [Schaalia odontolytica]|uniref:Bifunctional protein hldE n=1 Tax=Schaalia odontolytica TaxID=1660 RepID=A0A2X0U0D3_9ACTO|nr:adenylyltransferase/cytidyltransferase family protein [Schaalia odontolytica]WMS26948.1 adenylyltransferase/cytidyltransferase family protein [Schaalia odontolytica]SPT55594.1 Bifunctional protein hldE [Schaalia odontolytica]
MDETTQHRTPITGYVPGGFDMFHQGHLNILRAARERCDRLVVGVTSDEALIRMKGRAPVIPLKERCDLVSSLRFVDAVVVDLDQDKRLAWRLQPFDVLFKGDDWKDTPKGAALEAEMAEVGASVVYLPYTPSTSSTKLRRFIAPEDFSDEAPAQDTDQVVEGEAQ